MAENVLKKILRNKKLVGFIALILLGGGYFGYKIFKGNGKETRYVLASVEKGAVIVSVSGSGQVSASDQIDIKSKANSEVAAVYIEKGGEVKAGKLILKLDDTDFQKAVRDAQTSLETAKLELEKLLAPDEITLLQAENSLDQAKQSKQNSKDDLEKKYGDAFDNITNVFLDLPKVMSGLQAVLFGADFNGVISNLDYYSNAAKTYDERAIGYKDDAYNAYQKARKEYDQNFQDYKATNEFSDKSVIEALINQTYQTTKSINEALKEANNLIQFYEDKFTEHNLKPQAFADTHLLSLNTYMSKTNTHLLNLSSIESAIQTNKEAIADAEKLIEEKELSLAKMKAGPDELDIRSKKIAIQQKEDALITAKQNLAECYITASFDGIVAAIEVKKGDSVSAGTALASIITKQKITEISLNEVDITKIKVGQKATLTFDAVEGLSIAGTVLEIDTLGTVTQGVVTYNVKIGFGTQDERAKPGMSVSAAIITDSKQNVLSVPNSAVKTSGDTYYVEMLNQSVLNKSLLNSAAISSGIPSKTPPSEQSIEIGLANDSVTEITSGLKEGDMVIVRTVSSTSTSTTQNGQSQNQSLFQSGGGRSESIIPR